MSRYLALALALGLTVPAMAQTTAPAASFKHPQGWSLTLPAGIRAAPDAVNGQSITLMLVRGNVAVGACVVNVTDQPTPTTAQVWDQTVKSFLSNPEAESRAAAARSGHTFIRYLSATPIRSAAGWQGFSYWYERTNKTSGQLQTSYLASTMLSPTRRMSLACNSVAGYLFEPADYGRFRDLSSLVRVD